MYPISITTVSFDSATRKRVLKKRSVAKKENAKPISVAPTLVTTSQASQKTEQVSEPTIPGLPEIALPQKRRKTVRYPET